MSQRFCLAQASSSQVRYISFLVAEKLEGEGRRKDEENVPRHTLRRGPPDSLCCASSCTPSPVRPPCLCVPLKHATPSAHDDSLVSVRGRMRVPGILDGLNDRSQSAYAIPAPKPVPSATGHARPDGITGAKEVGGGGTQYEEGEYALRKRITDAITPALKPTPLGDGRHQHTAFRRRLYR